MKSRKKSKVRLWVFDGKGEFPCVSQHSEGTALSAAWSEHCKLFKHKEGLAEYEIKRRHEALLPDAVLEAGDVVTLLKKGVQNEVIEKLFETLQEGAPRADFSNRAVKRRRR